MCFRYLLSALVVWLFLCCTFAPVKAAENWIEVRTKNFVLVGDAGEKEIRQAAARLEQFRETFRMLFPRIKLDGGVRTNVVVFKNTVSYAAFKPKRPDGSSDDAVAGYFQAGEDVNYITLSVDKPGAYGTIFHEYVHFLLDVNIGRSDLPPWLGEGLAEYFETLQILDDQRVVLGVPPSGHLSLLRQNEIIPLTAFFSTDNAALHRRGDDSRSLFYAQAWALTHYLLHAERNKDVGLDDVINLVNKAESAEKLSQELFKLDQTVLEKVLRNYVSQPLPLNRIIPIPQKIAAETYATALSLSEAQATSYLGDLLYHTNNLPEAEALLRKALKLDSELSQANMSLGLVLARKKNFVEAKRYLEKAITTDRSNHFAYFNYAYAISRESMDEDGNVTEFPAESAVKMRDALQQSIRLNPGFAESYRLLAFVHFVNTTDLNEAVNLLNKGLAVRPGDQHFSLLLAQVLLRQEKYEEAASLAKKIIAGAANAEVWSEAMSVVQAVNQYNASKATGPGDPAAVRIFGPLPPLILKRSALSDAEVEKYEEDRRITNLNILIEKPRFGEKQVVGYVDKITCSDGNISYAIRSGGENFRLSSSGFGSIRLKVLTDGESSFTLDCGVSFGKQLTALIYQPTAASKSNTRGRLLSIAFVPDYFRLKTPQEMTNWRTVIIEDDRIFKNSSEKKTRPN